MGGAFGRRLGGALRLVPHRADPAKEGMVCRLFGGSSFCLCRRPCHRRMLYPHQPRSGAPVFAGGGRAWLCALLLYLGCLCGVAGAGGEAVFAVCERQINGGFSLPRQKKHKIFEFFEKALYFFEKMVYNKDVSLYRKEDFACERKPASFKKA